MNCWKGILVHTTFILGPLVYLIPSFYLSSEPFQFSARIGRTFLTLGWLLFILKFSIPFFRSPLRHLPSPSTDRFPFAHADLNGGKPPTDNISRMLMTTPNDGLIVLWAPFWLFAQVVPTRPDTLMDILNTHCYDWEKPAASRAFLRRILGDGLVGVEGAEHKAMRKVVHPAFSGRHIRALVPLMYKKALELADAVAREVTQSGDQSIEALSLMSRATLDLIGSVGVGKDFNTINNDDDPLARLYEAVTGKGRGVLYIMLVSQTIIPHWFLRLFKGSNYAQVSEAEDQLRAQVRTLMQQKKLQLLEKPDEQNDIISIIMRGGDFADDYLVDQLLTFLAAGHDTTAVSLTWALYLLCLNPMAQDRLRSECIARLTHIRADDVDASVFDAKSLPYLTAICNETLRLYPPVSSTARESVRPTTIGRYPIPAGTPGLLSMWAINRSSDFWGKDAEKFSPDRWLEGPNAALGGATSQHAFTSFIHGPRSCIGQQFALTEFKCLLAVLMTRFRFELAEPEKEVEIGGFVTIKPNDGMELKVYDVKVL